MSLSGRPTRPGVVRQDSRNGLSASGSPASIASPRFEDPPSRPERSLRRPLQTPSPATLQRGAPDGRFPDTLDRQGGSGSGLGGGVAFRDNGLGGASRPPIVTVGSRLENIGASPDTSPRLGSSAAMGASTGGRSKASRMMDQLNNSTSPSPASNSSPRLAPSSAVDGRRHCRRGSASSDASSSTSTSSRPNSPNQDEPETAAAPASAALSSAITAFTNAGARRDGRRGGLADQGFETIPIVKKTAALNSTEYPNTPAFREIDAVLNNVRSEWPVLMYGTTAIEGENDADKAFDPVTLALGLLDPSLEGGANSLQAFLRMKADLDHAIASTMSTSKSEYRAYESSITTYNATLGSVTSSQKQINDLKKRLGDAREKLEGKGREGLTGMYNRMSHLEEMIKILDEMCVSDVLSASCCTDNLNFAVTTFARFRIALNH